MKYIIISLAILAIACTKTVYRTEPQKSTLEDSTCCCVCPPDSTTTSPEAAYVEECYQNMLAGHMNVTNTALSWYSDLKNDKLLGDGIGEKYSDTMARIENGTGILINSNSIFNNISPEYSFRPLPLISRAMGGSRIRQYIPLLPDAVYCYKNVHQLMVYEFENEMADSYTLQQMINDQLRYTDSVRKYRTDLEITWVIPSYYPRDWNKKAIHDGYATHLIAFAAIPTNKARVLDLRPYSKMKNGAPDPAFYKPDGVHPLVNIPGDWYTTIIPVVKNHFQ